MYSNIDCDKIRIRKLEMGIVFYGLYFSFGMGVGFYSILVRKFDCLVCRNRIIVKNMNKIYIKNMVCDCCIMVVINILF